MSIGADGALPQLRTPAIHGRMSVAEALARLLENSGYVARRVGATAWRIERIRARSTPALPPQLPADAVPEAFASPIIVTATKRNQSLDQLPMALSVVRLSDARGVSPGSDTSWAASEIEGMALTALGSGRNRIFLRGIADSAFSGESQSTVAVLLDDARLTYAAPDPDIRLIDVDRIEVLKGPQGSLYGIGALGGIYHIVTRRADPHETSLSIAAGVEALTDGGTGLFGSAIGNVPILKGRAGLRIVAYTADEPGWVDTGALSDTNAARVNGTRAGVGLDAGDGWRIDFTGLIQTLDVQDSQYVYKPDTRKRPAQRMEPHDNDLRHVSARVARNSGGVDILLTSAMTWHEVSQTFDATIGAESFGLANPQRLDDNRKYRVWDSEARLSGTIGSVSWLFGLSHVEARQDGDWTLLSASSPPERIVDEDRRITTDSAAFGDLAFPVFEHVALDLGARLFRSNATETRQLGTGVLTRERQRTGVTPSVALSWRPRPGRLFFLRYGSAFRQGGTDIGANGELSALKGDELATIEAGWRESLPGGGQLDMGTYLAWWENLQSDALQPDGRIETETAGNARITGLEISLDQPLASGWRLQAGGSYAHALLVRNTLGYALSDRHLPVVPEYTLRGAIEHSFGIGPATASLRLQLRYLGPARLSFDPALDRPMGKALESRIEGRVELDGYELGLVLDNPLDRKADTFAFGNPLRFSAMRQYTPQRPFSASISLMKRF